MNLPKTGGKEVEKSLNGLDHIAVQACRRVRVWSPPAALCAEFENPLPLAAARCRPNAHGLRNWADPCWPTVASQPTFLHTVAVLMAGFIKKKKGVESFETS